MIAFLALMSIFLFIFQNSFYLFSNDIFLLSIAILLFILSLIGFRYRNEIISNIGYDSSHEKNIPFLFLIILSFGLMLRFILGPLKNGAFIDEFYQLFSALGILKDNTPVQVYVESGSYDRGFYVSYLVALSFKVFGRNIFAARLIPFFVGAANLILTYLIAKRISSRLVACFALIIVSGEPLMIFIHTYVREYVFIQFFVLFSLLILFNLRKHYLKSDRFLFSKKTWFLLTPFIFFNFISWYFTNSSNKYSVILVISLFALFFFLEIYWNKLKSLQTKKIISILIFLAIIMIISIFKFSQIQTILFGEVYIRGISLRPLSFTNILVSIYAPILLMFIIGFYLLFKENNKEAMYLAGIFLCIYILFEFLAYQKTIDGEYTQVRIAGRFIAFCMPIFFIIASKSVPFFLEIINKISKQILNSDIKAHITSFIVIFILITGALFAAYPAPYDNNQLSLRGPQYKDWGKGTDYLKRNINENDTVISIPAHGAEFYGPEPDYTIMTKDWNYANRTTGYKDGKKVYLMTDTPVLNSTDELEQIFDRTGNVWIIYSSDYLSRWSNSEIVGYVKNKTKKVEASEDWINITVLVSK